MSNRRPHFLSASILLLGAVLFFALQAVAQEGEGPSSTTEPATTEPATTEQISLAEDAAGLLTDTATSVAEEYVPEIAPEKIEAGREAFLDVAEVLQSPRCMNCHPTGNRPLQTDQSLPHSFNISRESEDAGLECATCHREQNSEAWGVAGGPPGAPHWGLPPRDMPMVFQDRTPNELCEQLKDPERSGHADLDEFMEHLLHDKLVHWGWEPGGDRTVPPLTYDEFIERASVWVESGGACPE